MSQTTESKSAATVNAENIGGISKTDVALTPGVTVLVGQNASNRTSFLQAIMAALGSTDVSLKADADEGFAELLLDEASYHRTLRREKDAIAFDGRPYLEDSSVADLFAFLVESNDARRAVFWDNDLRELLMRPVDTEAINDEIDRLERERDEVDAEIDELASLKDGLLGLREQQRSLQSEVAAKRDELDTLTTKLESAETDIDKTQDKREEVDSRLAALRDLRSDLEAVRSDIDVEEESIASLRSEHDDLQEELDQLSEASTDEIEGLERDIKRLREEKQRLETIVSDLQDIIQFNEDSLAGADSPVGAALGAGDLSDNAVTDQLVEDETVVCWTCGSEVARDGIEHTLNQLRSIRQERTADIRDIEKELETARAEKRKRERERRRRDELKRRLSDVKQELDERTSRLERLRARRDELSDEVTMVESEVEQLQSAEFNEILDLHKKVNEAEFDLNRVESELDDVTDRIDEIEDRLADESDLRRRREELTSELEAQRTRIDQIERAAVEEFNDRMDEMLEILEYDNLERIWIERVQSTARSGGSAAEPTAFELHVVRTTASGAVYEDTIDHLSESEREVTGLTFALAGYLVHDLHETLPFMLLDSLEAIDADRIADLVAYFSEYPTYLVVSLLPEDARALPENYTRVTEI